MNQSALRLFIRSIISEAKEVKDTKKAEKKDTKLPKSSGKLMDLKKELAALEQYRDEIQMAKFAEKTAETEVEFADLYKFKKELDAIKEKGVKLESDLEDQKNKIKEMIGMGSTPTMVDEKKKPNKPVEKQAEENKIAEGKKTAATRWLNQSKK